MTAAAASELLAPSPATAEPLPAPPVAAAGVESDETPPAAPGGQGTTPADLRELVRTQLLAARLPRGMRESLAAALPAVIAAYEAGPLVALPDLLSALETALPANWQADPTPPEARPHPAGEAFFTGDGPPSEEQASQIARAQLRRHGFLA